jgi:hypothetical protein
MLVFIPLGAVACLETCLSLDDDGTGSSDLIMCIFAFWQSNQHHQLHQKHPLLLLQV